MPVLDLYVFTLKFLAYKKRLKLEKKIPPPKRFFFYLFSTLFHCFVKLWYLFGSSSKWIWRISQSHCALSAARAKEPIQIRIKMWNILLLFAGASKGHLNDNHVFSTKSVPGYMIQRIGMNFDYSAHSISDTVIHVYVIVYKVGLTLWNQSSFEFKFDDTILSS
jgi:hypothetical protein